MGIDSWSEITREDWQFVESEKRCIHCETESNLQKEHIVLESLKIKDFCSECEKIQGIHNQIWTCQNYNSSKK